MHIAVSSDNNYAQHLGVTLASLLRNLAPGVVPQIHVIDGGLAEENKQKIAQLQAIRPFGIDYIKVKPEDFKHFPLGDDHITIATYFRLKIADLLLDLDKVLYLDIDMVIDTDLSPLWAIELLEDKWVAAAVELGVQGPFLETIGMAVDDFYFNAGVLLINLKALRQINFEQKCIDFVTQYKEAIRFVDQDVLNHVCRGHVLWLEPKYNVTFGLVDKEYKLERYQSPSPLADLQEALAKPAIIHFTGSSKPWHYACRHRFAYKYMEYLKETPWADYQYPDKNFKAFKSKYLYFLKQRWRQFIGK